MSAAFADWSDLTLANAKTLKQRLPSLTLKHYELQQRKEVPVYHLYGKVMTSECMTEET